MKVVKFLLWVILLYWLFGCSPNPIPAEPVKPPVKQPVHRTRHKVIQLLDKWAYYACMLVPGGPK